MQAQRNAGPLEAWVLPATWLVLAGVVFFLAALEERAWLALAVAPAVFAGLHRSSAWGRRARASFLVFLVAATLFAGRGLVAEIADNLQDTPEWDYLGFWLYARTAAEDGDFYAPPLAALSATGLSVSRSFQREIVATGFWYPPPSMFLFLPLGWLGLRPALAAWYLFHGAVLVLDVLLLWRIFFERRDRIGLAAVAALVAVCHGTFLTLHYAQTNFVALLGLLMLWRLRGRMAAGGWLAVALFTKPFLAALGWPLLAARRVRVLAGLALVVAFLALAAAVLFGPERFAGYVAGDSAQAKPEWIYREETNQSVLGYSLRARERRCEGPDCFFDPVYLAALLALGAVTLPVAWVLARRHEEWAGALCVLFALLVYPVSQSFYSVLLVPMLLLAWRERARFRGGTWVVAILAGATLGLSAYEDGSLTGIAHALAWAGFALVGLRLAQGRGWPLVASGASP